MDRRMVNKDLLNSTANKSVLLPLGWIGFLGKPLGYYPGSQLSEPGL